MNLLRDEMELVGSHPSTVVLVELAIKVLTAEMGLSLDPMEIERLERLRARLAPRAPSARRFAPSTSQASQALEDSSKRDLQQMVITRLAEIFPRLVYQEDNDFQQSWRETVASRIEEESQALKSSTKRVLQAVLQALLAIEIPHHSQQTVLLETDPSRQQITT